MRNSVYIMRATVQLMQGASSAEVISHDSHVGEVIYTVQPSVPGFSISSLECREWMKTSHDVVEDFCMGDCPFGSVFSDLHSDLVWG